MRNELKFSSEYQELKKIIFQEGGYSTFIPRIVNSIYFDDDRLSDFYDSEEGSLPRKKIRFRWYGDTEKYFSTEKTKKIEGTI